jgi:hypothetical protein
MGGSSKAICGTFKAGELKVGQGLDNKNSKNNPKWVDNVTPVNAFNLNEIEDKLKAHQEALDELLYVPLTINLTSNIFLLVLILLYTKLIPCWIEKCHN